MSRVTPFQIPYLVKLPTEDSIPSSLSNFKCLHFGLLIECDTTVTGNFYILFPGLVKVSRTVSIPEKCDMAKLNCLTVMNK